MLSTMKKQLTNIGALWLKKTQRDETMMTGSITLPDGSSLAITIFVNQFKTSADDRKPDLIIFTNAELWTIAQQMSAESPLKYEEPF
jgi:hypothetical protein